NRYHLRCHTECRKNYNIYLRMPEEPEQMLEQDRTSAFIGKHLTSNNNFAQEEACSEVAIEQQQHRTGKQYREGQYPENCGEEKPPNGKRHARHAHTFRAQVKYR